MTDQGPVTTLLRAWSRGDEAAREQLVPMVYAELRRRAASYLRRERQGHTLEPTALVHEVYLRLIDQRQVAWQNRAHFFGIASQMMRRILVDHARAQKAQKRGGENLRVELDESTAGVVARDVDLEALDDALQELQRLDERQCRIVELRYFGGLSIEETAEVTRLSPATVKREWTMARAWLHRRLKS